MNKREKGNFYETLACEYITDNGGIIIERNYRSKKGEVDIIARDGKYLCFVEVKYRTSDRYGEAERAVDFNKQRTISRVCDYYLFSKHFGSETPIRFDVVAINTDINNINVLKWHKNAFDYISNWR